MPYILKQARKRYDEHIEKLVQELLSSAELNSPKNNDKLCGELNYIIFRLAKLLCEPMDYARINTIIGAIESSKVEFQRRIVAPYENEKIQTNGDIAG
jgi:hypothetical protein